VYRDWARDVKGILHPEILVPITAHAAFDKAAQFLDIRIKKVPINEETCTVDLKAMRKMITKKTCMVKSRALQYGITTYSRYHYSRLRHPTSFSSEANLT
jgi:sphinganine-1-phosphate aldolase